MKKLFFILIMLFLGHNLYSQSWPYVTGPETGVTGVEYTYTVGSLPIDTAYIWTLYAAAPESGAFFDSVIVGKNTISLTFLLPGRYFLVSDHGYDIEINISNAALVSVSKKTTLFKTIHEKEKDIFFTTKKISNSFQNLFASSILTRKQIFNVKDYCNNYILT